MEIPDKKGTHWGATPQGWMFDHNRSIEMGDRKKQRYKMKRIRPKKPRKKIKI